MSTMDLVRHLRFFVTIAEEGHFGRAASRLHMTQPPLSQGLRRLEERLGVALVDRTPRGGTLTSAGRELLPRARMLVSDADRFEEEGARLSGSRDGSVRWGVVGGLSDSIVLACVRALGNAEPTREQMQANVTTTTAGATALVEAVRQRIMDVAVVEHPALLDGVRHGPVLRIPRWLVVPEGHPVTVAAQPRVRMLRGLSFATMPRADNPPAHDLLVDLWRERGLDPDVVTADDERSLLAQVASGGAFGVTTTRPSDLPGVCWVPSLREETVMRVRVIWNAERDLPLHMSALDRVLLEAGR
ncbi:LysR family transcriptional regulator [Rhodococcus sp. IEGM 1366]|uniref:LysR family transcriptional regulator n=1 Tax=Rhodococcus sp. IEGM 1366 TaxID=3082223 RepID=UPI002954C6D6|nr:LysR family transcriptional regulator [Rhodococcus sp. IEGM 1366]MDV8070783.1 LysR family transcriptional regulator [Rhodococcus sp. IEGM 1366]